ncbi:MAG: DinB family protein [Acidobacteriota bacterium]
MNDRGSTPLPPPLDDSLRQLRAVRDDFEALVDGLDDSAFNWAPHDRSWSIGQCLDHLARVDRPYRRRIERAIETAVARGDRGHRTASGATRWSLAERLFIAWMEPPPRLRLPAPPAVVPPSELEADAVCAAFRDESERLQRALHEARALDLRRLKIRSPLFPLLRLAVGASFDLLAAHGRRHLWQAWGVRRHDAFPSA